MNKLVMLGCGTAVAGLLALLLLPAQNHEKTSKARVEKRFEETRRAPDAPLVTVTREATPPVEAPPPATSPATQAAEEDEEHRAVTTPSKAEIAVALESSFDAQRGQRELRFAEETITTRAATMNVPGAHLQSLECRSTLCKMTVSFTGEKADNQFLSEMFYRYDRSSDSSRRFAAMGMRVTDRQPQPDGTTLATIYSYAPQMAPLVNGS